MLLMILDKLMCLSTSTNVVIWEGDWVTKVLKFIGLLKKITQFALTYITPLCGGIMHSITPHSKVCHFVVQLLWIRHLNRTKA